MRSMTMLLRYSFILLAAFTLAGCFSPVKLQQNTYVLNQVPDVVTKHHPRHTTLLIAVPDTRAVYNTTQMAYSIKPYQIAYFSENQWAETPSQMLQPLLVQTLQNTHYFHAVVTPPFMGYYDYTLNTQILQLLQDYTCRPALLKLKVRVMLSRASTNRVMAIKDISVYEPIWLRTPYGGVIAANHATTSLLRQITLFTLENLHF